MRKKLLLLLLLPVLAFVVATATSASAASPHFKKNGSPVCTVTDTGATVTTTCTASLSGLGNGDLVIEVTTNGFAVYQCQNGGGNIAPGQNKVLVGPTTTPTTIPGDQIKNGTVTFTTDPNTLSAPATVSGAQAGCPNNNWTGVNPNVTLTSISMTISQGGTTLFSCSSATNPNGLSGRVPLTC
jgi:hypothetical protein